MPIRFKKSGPSIFQQAAELRRQEQRMRERWAFLTAIGSKKTDVPPVLIQKLDAYLAAQSRLETGVPAAKREAVATATKVATRAQTRPSKVAESRALTPAELAPILAELICELVREWGMGRLLAAD